MVTFALRDVRADFRAAVDKSLALQHRQRVADGVARNEELGGEVLLGGQATVVGPGVNPVAQDVGDLAHAVGAGLTHCATARPWLPGAGKFTIRLSTTHCSSPSDSVRRLSAR